MTRRNYSNISAPVATTAQVASNATVIPVASTTGFPAVPFTAALRRGTTEEELVLVTATGGTDLTVTRAFGGTTAKTHPLGSAVEHVVQATDYDEANKHLNDTGQAEADHATLHNATRHAAVAHTDAMLAPNSITTAKLTSAVANALNPAGSMVMFPGSAAPAGWLLCDGGNYARTAFPDLFAALGAASSPWGLPSGTTFNVPDMRGRVPVGKDAGQAEFAGLAQAGGSKSLTLSQAQMPVHTHTQDAHAHSNAAHGHGVTDPAHSHNAGTNPDTSNIDFVINRGTGIESDRIPSGGNTTDRVYVTYTHDTSANGTGISIQASSVSIANNTATNQNAGGGQAIDMTQPYRVVNFIIKV